MKGRTRGIRRDDAFVPYAFLIAMTAHILFLLLLPALPSRGDTVVQHVYDRVSYRVLPSSQFHRFFSATDEVFSPDARDDGEVTSGNVMVPPDMITSPDPSGFIPAGPSRFLSDLHATPYRFEHGRAIIPASEPEGRPDLVSIASSSDEPASPRPSNLPFDENGRYSEAFLNESAAPSSREPGAGEAAGRPGIIEGSEAPARSGTGERLPGPLSGSADYPAPAAPLLPASRGIPTEPGYRPATTPPDIGPRTSDAPPEAARPEITPPSGSFGRRELLYSPKPEYPEWAERENVQAEVAFDIRVTPGGRVTSAEIAVSSGYPELDRLAREYVLRWLYAPSPGNEDYRRAIVRFRLRNNPR